MGFRGMRILEVLYLHSDLVTLLFLGNLEKKYLLDFCSAGLRKNAALGITFLAPPPLSLSLNLFTYIFY